MSHGFSHDEGGTALSPEEVLAEALLFGETDSAAFERAMQASSGEEIEHLEHAIGAIAVASGHLGPLPESVSSRCREALLGRIRASMTTGNGHASVAAAEPPRVSRDEPLEIETKPIRFAPDPAPPRNRLAPLGWMVAAAASIGAVIGWLRPAELASDAPFDASQARAALVSAGTQLINWSTWGEDERFEGVTGDVVWDDQAQEGYMTFVNLPVNDPSVSRYQLWIVDAERGAPLTVPPIDGGVFDVDVENDVVVVPIRAKLPVGEAAAFGITIEGPNGAVVSERRPEQLVVIAMKG